MSVIIGRALPDARDGLKTISSRILYAIMILCNFVHVAHTRNRHARGDVMGDCHPHGDIAVYDALVRMAQPFSMRIEWLMVEET